MKANKDLSESNVAIIGLGLMGGSLAMALRGHCKSSLGCDLDSATLGLARRKNLVHLADSQVETILPHADLIILATPVGAIMELLQSIPRFHQGPGVILDLGSTKVEVVKSMEGLPPGLEAIGGHPMCGKEASGLNNADKDLFRGATFALCAPDKATQRARTLVEQLVQVIGAKPLWMEPEIHDAWVGATSHLPYLLSLALVNATSRDASPLMSTGFLSASRLAASDPVMMRDIMLTNQDQVLVAIRRFQSKLENLKALIVNGDSEKLKMNFERSLRRYRSLIIDGEDG